MELYADNSPGQKPTAPTNPARINECIHQISQHISAFYINQLLVKKMTRDFSTDIQ